MASIYDPAQVFRFDTPTSTNQLVSNLPQAPTPTPMTPQNALGPPMATDGMTLADMIANLRGPNPLIPIDAGMTDTNLQNMIQGMPQLAARLRPSEGGPAYPGAPVPGWQGYNGTG